jgi:hypothetical protein
MQRLIAMFQETSRAACSGRLARPGIAGIGEDRLLPAMQQGRHPVDVDFVSGGASECEHHARGDSGARWAIWPLAGPAASTVVSA